jgi:hypothetical protein
MGTPMRSNRANQNPGKISDFLPLILSCLIGLLVCIPSNSARASWSLNIGYHNPPQSNLGVNFLYDWTQIALELGIGNIRTDANFDNHNENRDNDGVALGLGGDINGKFFFMKSAIRPYIQLGTLLGTYGSLGDNSGLGLGSGGLFWGGGLWFGQTSAFHGYLSLNLIGYSSFGQAGIGFSI